jgi:hypothetical protein
VKPEPPITAADLDAAWKRCEAAYRSRLAMAPDGLSALLRKLRTTDEPPLHNHPRSHIVPIAIDRPKKKR